jgi:hypothetical protein
VAGATEAGLPVVEALERLPALPSH